MRALITAAANMTGRIVAAIIGGFMTVVTIGAVVTAGIVVTAGTTNGLSSLIIGGVTGGIAVTAGHGRHGHGPSPTTTKHVS